MPIILYLVAIGISIKNQMNRIILTYKTMLSKKVEKQHVLNGRMDFNGYRVVTLSKPYTTAIGNHAKFEINKTILTCLN